MSKMNKRQAGELAAAHPLVVSLDGIIQNLEGQLKELKEHRRDCLSIISQSYLNSGVTFVSDGDGKIVLTGLHVDALNANGVNANEAGTNGNGDGVGADNRKFAESIAQK